MTGYNIGFVLVRLFSIYLAITAIQTFLFYLPSLFQPMIKFSDWILSAGFWLSAAVTLLPVACAIWIWRNVRFFVPEQADTEDVATSSSELMLIGVSLLGLYFLVWGIVSFVRVEFTLAMTQQFDISDKWGQRAPYFAELLIAIPMLLGRRRLAEILLRIKYAGTGQ